MTYEEILQAIKDAGYNVNIIAELTNRSRTSVYKVFQREMVSHHIAVSVCALLEKPITEVFPDVNEYHCESPEKIKQKKKEEGRKKVEHALKQAGLAA